VRQYAGARTRLPGREWLHDSILRLFRRDRREMTGSAASLPALSV